MKFTNTSAGEPSGSAENKHTFRRLLKLNRPQLKRMILAAVCVLLVNAAILIKPVILKIVIDGFLIARQPQKGLYSLTGMGVLYFAVVALSGVLGITQVNLINRAGQEIMRGLRAKVFKTIQLLPLSYLDKTSAGSLITRATNDVEALSEFYTDVLIGLFSDVFMILGIVCAMLMMDVRLTLVSFIVIPVMFAAVFFLRTSVKRNFKRMKKLIGRINGFMAENISGMGLVQIFHAEKEKKREFNVLNDDYYKVSAFQVWLNSFLKPAANVFQNIAIALLIWYGMGKIAGGTLQIGVLYAFTTYIKQFFDPVSDLADNYTNIQSAFVSADRIFELLDRENTLERLDEGCPAERIHGEIEFKDVWFSYNNTDWVLRGVSFKIKKGQTAAFVGETGAGKTTIISLISGFYKIQKGEILIDGVNINEYRKRGLRRHITVVLQDVFLFSETVEQNITLNDDIPRRDVERALKLSCAENFVRSLPGGLEAPVMERGATFSAGQRQLISFARAIAHDPSVIVLDEATANIDSRTENLIQRAIENMAKDRTTLIIAHRLSTIRMADKIIVLHQGEVVESGNHAELMQKDGWYSRMEREGSVHKAGCESALGG